MTEPDGAAELRSVAIPENEKCRLATMGPGRIGAGRVARRRKRRLDAVAAGALLFSCIAAASSSKDDSIAECSVDPETGSTDHCDEPRITKFSLDHLKILPSSSSSSLTGNAPQLGDGIRSAEASGMFFDSIDTDGDGAIEPEEVARFLQTEIGGTQFDTKVEVDEEVGAVMERLDQNHDNGLEMSDMLNYWMQLESLLTAEEVAEWIVYSVQLPSSIGK